MKIALIQMNSAYDWQPNMEFLDRELEAVSGQGAKIAFLPECFYSMSNGLRPTEHLIDLDRDDCEHKARIAALAKKYSISLVGGSVAASLKGKVVNRALNFDEQGLELPFYDKRKLFACRLKDKSITESDIYSAGHEPVLLDLHKFRIGLGICFDLRFSEFALHYRQHHANVLTFASAFTVPTGRAHWHILNRARAIESQCFVISSAQWGEHNERISTFGHSLVVDPWGEVLLDLKEGAHSGVLEINLDEVERVRSSVLMQR
jgi:deaminated glutathione amidase